MANTNNSNNGSTRDWLSLAKRDVDDANSLLGKLKKKPLSYFDALTRNFCSDSDKFQVNLGQFPQNFVVVTTGTGSKVKVLHSLFNVNIDPDTDTGSSVIGVYGINRVAPFKTFSATVAVQPMNIPARRSAKKGDTEPLMPGIKQFSATRSPEEFRDIIGDPDGRVVSDLAKIPSAHLIHPQVFIDIEGKREWEASDLGYKLVTLYAKRGEEEEDDDDDDDDDDESEGEGEEEGSRTIDGVYQLLLFLWAAAKQCGNPVTLKEIPEDGIVTSLCEKKAQTISVGELSSPGAVPTMAHGSAILESQRLVDAMVVNLEKSSEAYVLQISKDDSTKSALSRLAPDQASLFRLLTADDFDIDGTPELNDFARKLTENRDPMRAVNMLRQASRLWKGSISDKSLLQFLSSGYLAPDINQEPDGLTSLGFVPHYERHRFEDKNNVASDNMRSMFGEKTFDEDTIKRYTKKQFFFPTRIEDWAVQLESTIRFLDLLTCDDGIASEGYRTALDFYERNDQTLRTTFRNDKLIGVKILYFLDRVFQEFATDLSRYSSLANPLRSARNSLANRQRNTVAQTLSPLKYGLTLTMSLPAGLMEAPRIMKGSDLNNHYNAGKAGNEEGGGNEGDNNRLSSITIPQGFKLPKGRFGDYFNPREHGGERAKGWPQVPHDSSGLPKTICLRLMTTGKCPKGNCQFAHVLPAALGQKNLDAMATRLSEIYKN
jgi:hypothetical protein